MTEPSVYNSDGKSSRDEVIEDFCLLLKTKKLEDAKKLIAEISPDPHNELELCLKAASCYKALKEYDAANQLLLAVFRQHPKDIRIPLEIGSCLAAKKNFVEALEWYNAAERLNARNAWPYYLRAKLYRQIGRLDQAQKTLGYGIDHTYGYAQGDEYNNLVKDYCDTTAAFLEKKQIISTKEFNTSSSIGRALYNCAHVSLVKNEEDIIFFSLSNSYLIGFRLFVVADNNSDDSTEKEIRRFADAFPEAVVYIVHDPVIGYFQAAKTMGLARLAQSVFGGMGYEIEWIFPIDGDEILRIFRPDIDLHEILTSERAKAANIMVYHWIHGYSTQIYQHLHAGDNIPALLNKFSGFGKMPVRKVAFRPDPSAYLEVGNHYAVGTVQRRSDFLIGAEEGVLMVHYPIRSIYQIRNKVINGAAALEAGKISEQFGGHWRAEYKKFKDNGDNYFVLKIQGYNEHHATSNDL